jgi:hypothetical protein
VAQGRPGSHRQYFTGPRSSVANDLVPAVLRIRTAGRPDGRWTALLAVLFPAVRPLMNRVSKANLRRIEAAGQR